jgi:hypothetical protein
MRLYSLTDFTKGVSDESNDVLDHLESLPGNVHASRGVKPELYMTKLH